MRAKNIRRRLREEGLADHVSVEDVSQLPAELFGDELWEILLIVAETGELVEKGAESLELSLIARHALGLAQKFNTFYQKYSILKEKDESVRAARLAAVQVFRRGLETLGELLGIPVPEKM